MRTINPKSRKDRELLRKIGGRIVETCFTCVREVNCRCALHDFQFANSNTLMVFACNDHNPMVDASMFAVTHGISGKLIPRVKTPNHDTRPKQKRKKIYPGCYVTTVPFGEAVCTEVEHGWVAIRYEAVRCSDQKTLWVANSVKAEDCTYLQKADKASRAVLKMRGPYGEE